MAETAIEMESERERNRQKKKGTKNDIERQKDG